MEYSLRRDRRERRRRRKLSAPPPELPQRQEAKSFELRAALSLAKLCQSTSRPAEGYAALAPALEGFAPTAEMPEIAEERALMDRLA